MTERPPVVLSVEELALSVSLMGYPEDAATLLRAQFGELTAAQAQSYLEAASHSLLARGWVVRENGDLALSPILREVIQGFTGVQFSLHLQKRPRSEPPVSLTFHFGPNYVLAHSLSYDVAHQFHWLNPQDVLPAGWAFFEVPEEQWEQEGDFGTIPGEMFRAFYKAQNQADRQSAVERMGLPAEVQEELLEDLEQATYRGLISLLEYDAQRRPYSNEGAFVLQGPNRTWLFASAEQEEHLRIQWMNTKNYKALLRRLMRLGYERSQPSEEDEDQQEA